MGCENRGDCLLKLQGNGSKSPKCDRSKCLESCDNRPLISVSEKKKKYILENDKNHKIAVFHIDEGMILDQNITKCDNLILDFMDNRAIFVELKGSDLRHAIKQIESTMDLLEEQLKEYILHARIVTSDRTNVPDLHACPQYLKLARKAETNIKPREIRDVLSKMKNGNCIRG